ncbi:MAG: hypothetical protein KKG35_02985 [Proteobacteria bacterium]|nr:hypothetical protein [Pseudomonadota bacterium]
MTDYLDINQNAKIIRGIEITRSETIHKDFLDVVLKIAEDEQLLIDKIFFSHSTNTPQIGPVSYYSIDKSVIIPLPSILLVKDLFIENNIFDSLTEGQVFWISYILSFCMGVCFIKDDIDTGQPIEVLDHKRYPDVFLCAGRNISSILSNRIDGPDEAEINTLQDETFQALLHVAIPLIRKSLNHYGIKNHHIPEEPWFQIYSNAESPPKNSVEKVEKTTCKNRPKKAMTEAEFHEHADRMIYESEREEFKKISEKLYQTVSNALHNLTRLHVYYRKSDGDTAKCVFRPEEVTYPHGKYDVSLTRKIIGFCDTENRDKTLWLRNDIGYVSYDREIFLTAKEIECEFSNNIPDQLMEYMPRTVRDPDLASTEKPNKALKWGAWGAGIGSLLPGFGTLAGAAIGGATGAWVGSQESVKSEQEVASETHDMIIRLGSYNSVSESNWASKLRGIVDNIFVSKYFGDKQKEEAFSGIIEIAQMVRSELVKINTNLKVSLSEKDSYLMKFIAYSQTTREKLRTISDN